MLDLEGRNEGNRRAARPVQVPALHIRVIEGATTQIVVLAGEVDLAERETLRDRLHSLGGTVVVDLGAVTFLGSTGLGVLAGARKRLRSDGGDLFVRSPQDHVRRVLEVTGLDVMLIGAANTDA